MSERLKWKPYLMTPTIFAMLGGCIAVSAFTRYSPPAYGGVIFGFVLLVGGILFLVDGFRKPVVPQYMVREMICYVFLVAFCFVALNAFAVRDYILIPGASVAIALQIFQIYDTRRTEGL